MFELGILAWIGGGFLAAQACAPDRGRRLALVVTVLVLGPYGGLVLLSLLLGSGPGLGFVQLGLLLTYGLIYGLVGAGVVRGFVRDSYAPLLAAGIAAALPFASHALFMLVGDPLNPVSEGMGHLSDLLFLTPSEMGHGIRQDGFIPHKYRVHYFALSGALLFSVALQFLPARARMSRPSAAAGQIGNSST